MASRSAGRRSELSPRERLLAMGPRSLSDAELVAVLLRTGRRSEATAMEQALTILDECGGIGGLLQLDASAKKSRSRCVPATLLSAVELGKRLPGSRRYRKWQLNSAQRLREHLGRCYPRPEEEVLTALWLDAQLYLKREPPEIVPGPLRWSELDPGKILAQALLESAIAFHVVHVVPGGEPEPSAAEVDFCRRLVATAKVVGVWMVEYVIYAGEGRWRSLYQCPVWDGGAVVGDEVLAAADSAARGVEAPEGARRPPARPPLPEAVTRLVMPSDRRARCFAPDFESATPRGPLFAAGARQARLFLFVFCGEEGDGPGDGPSSPTIAPAIATAHRPIATRLKGRDGSRRNPVSREKSYL